MKMITAAAAAALALAGCSAKHGSAAQNSETANPQRPSDAESEAYMRKAETQWTVAPLKDRRALLERILADDYVGIGTHGALYDKRAQIAADTSMPDDPGSSARLDYLHYRHFGDTVLAQGHETSASSGKTRNVVFTDVWMFRNGKWQIVAGQDTVVTPK